MRLMRLTTVDIFHKLKPITPQFHTNAFEALSFDLKNVLASVLQCPIFYFLNNL